MRKLPATFALKWICITLTAPALIFGFVLDFMQRNRLAQGLAPGLESGQADVAAPFRYVAYVPAVVSIALYLTKLSEPKRRTYFEKFSAKTALAEISVPYVICWAMNDTIAVFAFVYVMLSAGEPVAYIPYLALTLVLNLAMFPRVDALYLAAVEKENAGTQNESGTFPSTVEVR